MMSVMAQTRSYGGTESAVMNGKQASKAVLQGSKLAVHIVPGIVSLKDLMILQHASLMSRQNGLNGTNFFPRIKLPLLPIVKSGGKALAAMSGKRLFRTVLRDMVAHTAKIISCSSASMIFKRYILTLLLSGQKKMMYCPAQSLEGSSLLHGGNAARAEKIIVHG